MAEFKKLWSRAPRAWFKNLKALHKIFLGFSAIVIGMMAIGSREVSEPRGSATFYCGKLG